MSGDILDRIDAAIGCQQCAGPLGDSPSSDFCSPDCLEGWHGRRVEPLTGYEEPWDLPQHYSNFDGYDLDDSENLDFGLWQMLRQIPEFVGVSPAGLRPMHSSWEGSFLRALSRWEDVFTQMFAGVAAESTIYDEITWYGLSPPSEPPAEPWDGLPDYLQQGCHEFEDCARRGLPWSSRGAEAPVMPDLPVPTVVSGAGPERSRRVRR